VQLNFGDCFAYALAKSAGEPLLFKGEDFSRTDFMPAAIAQAGGGERHLSERSLSTTNVVLLLHPSSTTLTATWLRVFLWTIFDKQFGETRKLAWISELLSGVKNDDEKLAQELGATGTTDECRAAVLEEMERLLAPYCPVDKGGSG
jgi:hypothetical protein